MDFKTWLEMRDIPYRDTSAVKLDNKGANLVYRWLDKDGDEYKVVFSPERVNLGFKQPINVPNVWLIELHGPQGLELTGKGNFANVYSHMLLAIKKMIENGVSGFAYDANVDRMSLVYERFLQMFDNFVRISEDLILRQDVWQDVLSRMSPTEQYEIEQNIKRTISQYQSHLGSLRKK